MIRWAARWNSENKLDGERHHIICCDCLPILFRTRAECRAWIAQGYGCIKNRPDLRREPHGWRMPTAVRVTIEEVR